MKFTAFDTENAPDGTLTLCVFFDGIDYIVFDYKDYNNQLNFKDAIINHIYNISGNFLFAHNLEYDLINIFYPFNLEMLTLFYKSKLLYARLKNSRKKFLDSFNFSFSSLKEIGKNIGIEKIETDDYYDIDYCKRDTEIVYRYMENFINQYKKEFSLKLKSTLAGCSQQVFLQRFISKKITGKNIDPVLLQGYYGGRCEIFTYGRIEKIAALDINSSYPFSMLNKKYPVSEHYKTKYPQEEYYMSHVRVSCNDNIKYPILPMREERLLFPGGEFETWVSSEELKEAERRGHIKDIEYIETYNFDNAAYIFKEFIKYFYDKRETAKNDKNKFLSQFYKLIMNSTYGRFGLKGNLTSIENEMESIVEIKNTNAINFALPLFVTAYSRIALYEAIIKIADKTEVIYVDTDSIYFSYKNKNHLKSILEDFKIDNAIGNFSYEEFNYGIFLNCKQYLTVTDEMEKYTIKGVPKDNRPEFFHTGKTKFKTPVKYRESLKSVQGLIPNLWIEKEKRNINEYKKRIIIDYDKKPFYKKYDTEALKLRI